MYTLILDYLRLSDMRLWFNICLRLGKILLNQPEKASQDRFDGMLFEMKAACKLPGADPLNEIAESYDMSKGNLVLEAFALEIQAYTLRR